MPYQVLAGIIFVFTIWILIIGYQDIRRKK